VVFFILSATLCFTCTNKKNLSITISERYLMLTLYYANGTAALAPHIVLEEAKADYKAQLIDFSKMEQQSPEYLATNPKGRVPTLKTPQGLLTETPAILAYIAQTHPNANLAPTDPFEFATAQAFNIYLAATVHVAHAHKLRGHRWSDDPDAHKSMTAKVTHNMAECARMIEAHYFKGPWVLGNTYSICDPYLFTVSQWMTADGVNLDEFPIIKEHSEAMKKRAAVQRVMDLHK